MRHTTQKPPVPLMGPGGENEGGGLPARDVQDAGEGAEQEERQGGDEGKDGQGRIAGCATTGSRQRDERRG